MAFPLRPTGFVEREGIAEIYYSATDLGQTSEFGQEKLVGNLALTRLGDYPRATGTNKIVQLEPSTSKHILSLNLNAVSIRPENHLSDIAAAILSFALPTISTSSTSSSQAAGTILDLVLVCSTTYPKLFYPQHSYRQTNMTRRIHFPIQHQY